MGVEDELRPTGAAAESFAKHPTVEDAAERFVFCQHESSVSVGSRDELCFGDRAIGGEDGDGGYADRWLDVRLDRNRRLEIRSRTLLFKNQRRP